MRRSINIIIPKYIMEPMIFDRTLGKDTINGVKEFPQRVNVVSSLSATLLTNVLPLSNGLQRKLQVRLFKNSSNF